MHISLHMQYMCTYTDINHHTSLFLLHMTMHHHMPYITIHHYHKLPHITTRYHTSPYTPLRYHTVPLKTIHYHTYMHTYMHTYANIYFYHIKRYHNIPNLQKFKKHIHAYILRQNIPYHTIPYNFMP